MHAIILAAGFGVRLEKVAKGIPKALLPMGRSCILDYLVTSLWQEPVSRVHIVHNARDADRFRYWRKRLNWIRGPGRRVEPPYLKLHNSGAWGPSQRRGAVGDLDYVVGSMSKPGGVLVAFGDNLYPPPRFSELIDDSPAVTIRRIQDIPCPDGLGRVQFAAGLVEDIGSDLSSGWAFAGPAYLDRESLPDLRSYVKTFKLAEVTPDDIGEFFSRLDHVRAVVCEDGPFYDVGTPESYHAARRYFSQRGAGWKYRRSRTSPGGR